MNTVSRHDGDFYSDRTLLMFKLKLSLKCLLKDTKIPRFQTELLRDSTKKATYISSLSTRLRDILSTSTSLKTPEVIDQLAERTISAILETVHSW